MGGSVSSGLAIGHQIQSASPARFARRALLPLAPAPHATGAYLARLSRPDTPSGRVVRSYIERKKVMCFVDIYYCSGDSWGATGCEVSRLDEVLKHFEQRGYETKVFPPCGEMSLREYLEAQGKAL